MWIASDANLASRGQAAEGIGKQYVRPPASADLSLTHPRLARSNDSPHSPEQIHIALAGVGLELFMALCPGAFVLSVYQQHIFLRCWCNVC